VADGRVTHIDDRKFTPPHPAFATQPDDTHAVPFVARQT